MGPVRTDSVFEEGISHGICQKCRAIVELELAVAWFAKNIYACGYPDPSDELDKVFFQAIVESKYAIQDYTNQNRITKMPNL